MELTRSFLHLIVNEALGQDNAMHWRWLRNQKGYLPPQRMWSVDSREWILPWPSNLHLFSSPTVPLNSLIPRQLVRNKMKRAHGGFGCTSRLQSTASEGEKVTVSSKLHKEALNFHQWGWSEPYSSGWPGICCCWGEEWLIITSSVSLQSPPQVVKPS